MWEGPWRAKSMLSQPKPETTHIKTLQFQSIILKFGPLQISSPWSVLSKPTWAVPGCNTLGLFSWNVIWTAWSTQWAGWSGKEVILRLALCIMRSIRILVLLRLPGTEWSGLVFMSSPVQMWRQSSPSAALSPVGPGCQPPGFHTRPGYDQDLYVMIVNWLYFICLFGRKKKNIYYVLWMLLGLDFCVCTLYWQYMVHFHKEWIWLIIS